MAGALGTSILTAVMGRYGMICLALMACLLLTGTSAFSMDFTSRKLLQRIPGVPRVNQQYVAQRTAATMTQQQIRAAVDNPGFGSTRAATDVGAITAATATWNPCALTGGWGPGCWNGYGGSWGWRR